VAVKSKAVHEGDMSTQSAIQPDFAARGPARLASAPVASAGQKLSVVVIAFIVSLIIPLVFEAGPLRLSAYRTVLALAFFPSLWIWLSGAVGRIRTPDILVMVFVLWLSVSEIYHQAEGIVEAAGVTTLESLGAYLLGRAFIRNPAQFRKMAGWLFGICLALAPFAIYETLTGTNLVMQLWSMVGTTNSDVRMSPRLGLDRVQGPFDHPIHFGVLFAPVFGLTYFVLGYGRAVVTRFVAAGIVFGIGFLSLSSGPISSYAVQLMLILWLLTFRWIKGHWWVFLTLALIAYIVVDILSNRTPIEVAIAYLALNPTTGYGRIIIWEWGWVNILNNPLFGLGRANDWERLEWMSPSFDMYWLLFPMTYGIVAGVAHLGTYLSVFLPLVFRKITDPMLASYRMGWVTGSLGMLMAGWMVHFWAAPLALHFFLFGCGVWMLSYETSENEDTPDEDATQGRTKPRYSRFAHRPNAREDTPRARPSIRRR
jgi:hypothetical protein